MQNEKEAKELKREMNCLLATAKITKAASLALYYIGLASPVIGVANAFTKDSLQEGLGTALTGTIMGVGIIVGAAILRQTNLPILRDYVETRNQLNELNNQKVK